MHYLFSVVKRSKYFENYNWQSEPIEFKQVDTNHDDSLDHHIFDDKCNGIKDSEGNILNHRSLTQDEAAKISSKLDASLGMFIFKKKKKNVYSNLNFFADIYFVGTAFSHSYKKKHTYAHIQ